MFWVFTEVMMQDIKLLLNKTAPHFQLHYHYNLCKSKSM